MSVCRTIHHCGPDRNISASIGLIAMKFIRDIYLPQRMKPTALAFSSKHCCPLILFNQHFIWSEDYWLWSKTLFFFFFFHDSSRFTLAVCSPSELSCWPVSRDGRTSRRSVWPAHPKALMFYRRHYCCLYHPCSRAPTKVSLYYAGEDICQTQQAHYLSTSAFIKWKKRS